MNGGKTYGNGFSATIYERHYQCRKPKILFSLLLIWLFLMGGSEALREQREFQKGSQKLFEATESNNFDLGADPDPFSYLEDAPHAEFSPLDLNNVQERPRSSEKP